MTRRPRRLRHRPGVYRRSRISSAVVYALAAGCITAAIVVLALLAADLYARSTQ